MTEAELYKQYKIYEPTIRRMCARCGYLCNKECFTLSEGGEIKYCFCIPHINSVLYAYDLEEMLGMHEIRKSTK